MRFRSRFALHALARAASVLAMITVTAVPAAAAPFPDRIDLPDGLRPEGIAVGDGTTFFAGSIPTGDIFRGDLRTGAGEVFSEGAPGDAAIGLSYRDGHLFVAGGPTGRARILDANTGEVLAAFQLTTESTFVNDVVATDEAAYLTDSVNPVLYRVTSGGFETLPLTGDLVYQEGFNVNGIDATPDGSMLVLVQSNTGMLFTADPHTGATRSIDLGGETVPNGDGILLDGTTLYVVQNRLNLIAVVDLNPSLTTGVVATRIGNDDFDVPTTIAEFGNSLYAVNARFGHPSPDTAEYWVTRLTKPR